MKKDGRLELRLDADLRAKVEALARLRGIPASAAVRRAIIDAHKLAFPDALAKTKLQPVVRQVQSTASPDTLTDFHVRLWDRPSSNMQARLYEAHARGYVNGVTEEQVDAVLTMAFFIAPIRPNDSVAILAPPDATKLIEQRIVAAVAAARAKPIAATVNEVYERMKMGLPGAWWPTEPRVWVAIGMAVDETTPKWLRRRLVEVGS